MPYQLPSWLSTDNGTSYGQGLMQGAELALQRRRQAMAEQEALEQSAALQEQQQYAREDQERKAMEAARLFQEQQKLAQGIASITAQPGTPEYASAINKLVLQAGPSIVGPTGYANAVRGIQAPKPLPPAPTPQWIDDPNNPGRKILVMSEPGKATIPPGQFTIPKESPMWEDMPRAGIPGQSNMTTGEWKPYPAAKAPAAKADAELGELLKEKAANAAEYAKAETDDDRTRLARIGVGINQQIARRKAELGQGGVLETIRGSGQPTAQAGPKIALPEGWSVVPAGQAPVTPAAQSQPLVQTPPDERGGGQAQTAAPNPMAEFEPPMTEAERTQAPGAAGAASRAKARQSKAVKAAQDEKADRISELKAQLRKTRRSDPAYERLYNELQAILTAQ